VTFDDFLQTAWDQHGDSPQDVADRLGANLRVIDAPAHIPRFAALVTHVFGEHLGQWHEGAALLESLRSLPAFDGSAPVAGALARNIAALRFAGGNAAALDPLTPEQRVSALATAAAAFTGLGRLGEAIPAYAQALRLAGAGLPDGSPAARALAIGGNNLAAALEAKPDRDAAETQGMLAAAEGGLRYWKLAGTWLEEERAEYRRTRSLLQAGQPEAAIASAKRCVAVCERNDAPAFERFFGYAVLALAQRSAGDTTGFETAREQALRLFAQVPEEERRWCEQELEELRA
jgi:tetratricopeptide (TPR) repeat protein